MSSTHHNRNQSISILSSLLDSSELENVIGRQIFDAIGRPRNASAPSNPSRENDVTIDVENRPETEEDTEGNETREATNDQSEESEEEDPSPSSNNNNNNSSTEEVLEIQLLIKWLESNVAFILLFLMVFVYHHKHGILVFVWLYSTLVHASGFLKRQSQLKENRQSIPLCGMIGKLYIYCIIIQYFTICSSSSYYHSIIYNSSSLLSFFLS